MTFWLAEPNSHSGSSNVWLTPRHILDALGPFDLDPAGHEGYEIAPKQFYERDNGLYQPWSGLVWCNPPYGVNTGDWVQRWLSHRNGFLLVAARSDTFWWHTAAKGSDLVWFPRGRIKFTNVNGTGTSPAFASCIFAAGEEAERRLRKMTGVFMRALP